MPIDKTHSSSLAIPVKLSLPWRQDLWRVHSQATYGNTHTFQNGIEEFERIVRTDSSVEGAALRLAMLSGRANASQVVKAYAARILEPQRYGPRLVAVRGGAVVARTKEGDVAISPRNALHHADVANASIKIIDARIFPNDDVPRLQIPINTYLRGNKPERFVSMAEGLLARGPGLLLLYDPLSYRFQLRERSGEELGSFSPIDLFVERVNGITNGSDYRTAWNAHRDTLLSLVSGSTMALIKAFGISKDEMESYEDNGAELTNGEMDVMRRIIAPILPFREAMDPAFKVDEKRASSWEYISVASNRAKINNAFGSAMAYIHMDDVTRADIVDILKSFSDMLDPIDHLKTVYSIDSSIRRWIEVDVVKGSKAPNGMSLKQLAALQTILDEIVHEAGAAATEKKKAIEFSIFNNATVGDFMLVEDIGEGEALSAFAMDEPAHERLSEMLSGLGRGSSMRVVAREHDPTGKAVDSILFQFVPDEARGIEDGYAGLAQQGVSLMSAIENSASFGLAPISEIMISGAPIVAGSLNLAGL